MKQIAKTSYLLLASRWKRTVSFILLVALLSTTAGLLGNHFINKKNAIEPIKIAVVNEDTSVLARFLLNTLERSITQSGVMEMLTADQQSAEHLMENGEVAAIFLIPEDFLDSVMEGTNKPVKAAYNESAPIQAEIVKLFVEQLLQVLKSNQIGIYTGLNYTRENHPEKYDQVMEDLNNRFIDAALSYNTFIRYKTVSVLEGENPFVHFVFAGLIFLLALGLALFTDIFQTNFSRPVLYSLGKRGVSSLSIAAGCAGGWWLWYSGVALVLAAGYSVLAKVLELQTSPMVYAAMVACVLVICCFGTAISFVFSSSNISTLVASIFAFVLLAFSGGVIPLGYLPSNLQSLAKALPGYWLMDILKKSTLGIFSLKGYVILGAYSCVFIAAASLGISYRGRGKS